VNRYLLQMHFFRNFPSPHRTFEDFFPVIQQGFTKTSVNSVSVGISSRHGLFKARLTRVEYHGVLVVNCQYSICMLSLLSVA